jgi:hypothetical protein
VDDAAFLRRVSLDLKGQLPTPEEVQSFVAGATKTKRSELIDKLIASPSYVDHWTLKWGDLLQNSRKYLGEKGAFEFREWIRDSIARNKPYDGMVREMLTAKGSSYENPAANFYRVTRDPKPTMEKTTQVFLGVRMVCAQCHDHPFERWTQNQYYEMAAFFSAVGLRPGYEVGEEILYDQRQDYDMKHPKDGRVMNPKFIVPASWSGTGAPPTDAQRRQAYAEWLTARDNPFFAKSTVNRVWSYFFGRGIIDPVDDIRASNPPSNPALLDALAKDFLDHNFDLRYLMRTIANSRTYQASVSTNEWNEKDGENFSHAIPRRLSAEELMDALAQATGVQPVFPEAPPDTRAEQVTDPHVGKDGFLDLFGRPARESSCECERRSDLSLPQALNLVNGKVDGGSALGMHLAVDCPLDDHILHACRRERDAQAGSHEAHEGGPLRCVLDDVGMKSVSLAAGHRPVKRQRTHAASKEDERLVAQVGHAQRALASQAMEFRQDGDIRLLQQGGHLNSFRRVSVPQEGQIDCSIEQCDDLGGGNQFAQSKLDFGIAPAVTLDDGREIREHHGAAETHREGAFLAASQAAHLCQVVVNFFDGAARALGEKLAGKGELDSARGTVQKAVTDELFQTFDLLAERRLRNTQTFRCLAEVKRLRHGQEVAKMAKLDFFIHTIQI